MMKLDPKIPPGPLETKWDRRRFSEKLVSLNNKRNITVIVVGTGLAGASAASTLGQHKEPLAFEFVQPTMRSYQ